MTWAASFSESWSTVTDGLTVEAARRLFEGDLPRSMEREKIGQIFLVLSVEVVRLTCDFARSFEVFVRAS